MAADERPRARAWAGQTRAMRETVGLSQREFAELVGVGERVVRNWESGKWETPGPVVDRLEALVAAHDRAVADAMAGLSEIAEERGGPPELAHLAYYRTQREYDALGRDPGPVGIVNARTRAIGTELRKMGVEVAYLYPAEDLGSWEEARATREPPE